jgi:putative ABC transport system permease protein
MGVRVLRGRGIADGDAWRAPRVAVVNQAMASAHFEYGVAVGRTIQVGRGSGSGWFTVVGVVEDSKPTALGGAFQPPYAVYVSALQLPPSASELLVRPRAGGADVAAAERTVRASLGGAGTVIGRVGESERLDVEAAPVAWFGWLIRLEGFGVLAIAMLGMFAVMQIWVRALAPELAVRRAVGARRLHIVSYVLVRAVAVALAGVGIGLWIGQLTSGGLASAIPGLPPRDLSLVLGPAIALAAAALAGALIPGARAARAAPAPMVAGLES